MPAYDTSQADFILREILSDDYQKMFNEAAIGFNLIPDGSGHPSNVSADGSYTYARGTSWPVELEPNPAGGPFGEGAALQIGGTSVGKRMATKYTRYHIAAELTGDILVATQQDVVAGSQKLGRRVAQDEATLLKMINEDFWEDGTNVKGIVASNATPVITTLTPFYAGRIRKNGLYDVYDPTGVTQRFAANKANSLVPSTGAVTFNAATTGAVANDIIVQTGGVLKGLKGIPYHLNDGSGDYQGLDRPTYASQLNTYVRDGATTLALSVAELDLLEARILFKRGADYKFDDHIWMMGIAQRHGYRKLGYNSDSSGSFVVKRFEGPGGTLDLGYETLMHNGRKIVIDSDMRDTEVYLWKTSTMRKHINKPIGPLADGLPAVRQKPAFTSAGVGSYMHAYVYYLDFFGQLSCQDPQQSARIKALSTVNLPLRNY